MHALVRVTVWADDEYYREGDEEGDKQPARRFADGNEHSDWERWGGGVRALDIECQSQRTEEGKEYDTVTDMVRVPR